MLRIETFPCNPLEMNCYLVWDDVSREAFIIDPGFANQSEWQRVADRIEAEHLVLKSVLLTHNHVDHCMGSAFPAKAYHVEIFGSMEDQNHMPSTQVQANVFGLGDELHWLPITQDVKEGDVLKLGQSRVEVLDCPGHSHHGLCYHFVDDKLLFSGDVLFYCSIGRSDFGRIMGGDGPLLIQGITSKLLTLPADVIVYPGHGPRTSIATERAYNPCLRT